MFNCEICGAVNNYTPHVSNNVQFCNNCKKKRASLTSKITYTLTNTKKINRDKLDKILTDINTLKYSHTKKARAFIKMYQK